MTAQQPQEPEQKRCKAILEVADDYGDNSGTFHCQLPAGHNGQHQEDWNGVFQEIDTLHGEVGTFPWPHPANR